VSETGRSLGSSPHSFVFRRLDVNRRPSRQKKPNVLSGAVKTLKAPFGPDYLAGIAVRSVGL
jgi:hypothetical protein